MLDIDHFKRINDIYGHGAGDAVLRQVARVLLAQVRDADFVVRYGGEEFVLVLPETDVSRALSLAERVRQAVASASLRLPDGRELSVTVSLGIAALREDIELGEELLRHADRARYAAKERGRNRVERDSD
jgi:two-component system cell cycle response regulator